MGVLWVDYIKDYKGHARGTFINRKHFAGFIEMVWPLGLGVTLALGNWQRQLRLKDLLDSDRPHLQFLFSTAMAFMLLALLFSRSRAGITGAFVGFITFVLLMRAANKGLPLSFWLMIVAVIGLISFYSSQMGFESILDRFFRVSTDNSRLDFWRDSLVIVKEHPLGTGLGTFKQVFPVYNVSSISEKEAIYAHNDYLQLLVEAGWIGFLALVGGFAIFMVRSIRKVKKLHIPDDPLRFFLVVGALSGLVSISFHSFFDFNLQSRPIAFIL
jgi:O-antigen ligase